jgi:penicillin amidase
VHVERDELGVPTIRATSRNDAARVLGFLHAQDRFFQMDLLRRQGAGELAEILGPTAVELDHRRRIHRFRHRARRMMKLLPADDRELIEAYTAGVNAGLFALGDKPFEYLMLRTNAVPWRPEDSMLVSCAMFFELHDYLAYRESALGFLEETAPRALFDFLTPAGTEWDAPLVGEALEQSPIPGPHEVNLRRRPQSTRVPMLQLAPDEPLPAVGSNSLAVSAARSADGYAWLANDMHLAIGVPNIWYRVSVVRPHEAGGTIRITGVTLPGAPIVVVGSNGYIAWGLTNTSSDWTDVVLLESGPDANTYRTPVGPRAFDTTHERIKVKGSEDQVLEITETIWGPVIDKDYRGRLRVLAWTAHHPEAVNFEHGDLERARTLEEAIAVANRSGIPPQNFVVADNSGRIAWTISGRIPLRVGFTGQVPTSWADGSRRWNGWLPPHEAPHVVERPSGRIWTANARVVSGEMLAKIGEGGYELGARARQIRDALMKLDKATADDLLAIQLDDRAVFLKRWRQVMLQTLSPRAIAGHAGRRQLRHLVETRWTGRASVDSAGYRAVRAFRNFLIQQTFIALTAQETRPEQERFAPTTQFEGPLWRLVTERPPHLLNPRFSSWDEQFLAAIDALLAFYATKGPNLAERTWGEVTTTRIRHPLSAGAPLMGRWLDVPPRPLPGDVHMPRVQGASFGASQRLVVSAGREGFGFFHMPVGQSGHPLHPTTVRDTMHGRRPERPRSFRARQCTGYASTHRRRRARRRRLTSDTVCLV